MRIKQILVHRWKRDRYLMNLQCCFEVFIHFWHIFYFRTYQPKILTRRNCKNKFPLNKPLPKKISKSQETNYSLTIVTHMSHITSLFDHCYLTLHHIDFCSKNIAPEWIWTTCPPTNNRLRLPLTPQEHINWYELSVWITIKICLP